MIPVALTIAGSDPSGGAGLQADLKTFHQHGVYGEAVVTLVTVQNTVSVERVVTLDAELVRAQVLAVVDDIAPQAVKTGALGSALIVRTIAELSNRLPLLVVDPVMISKHGARLLPEDAIDAFRTALLPRAHLVTPNTHEAEALSGIAVTDVASARLAAENIARLGPHAVLVKGGHLVGDPVDVLFADGAFHEFVGTRVSTEHTHGTGCTLSAAITARLARGVPLPDAVSGAKFWLSEALRSAPGLGHGVGPVNHLASVHTHQST